VRRVERSDCMKMNGIREKIGRRKTAVAILLVSIIVFSVVYASIQTRAGLAVLTSPPPGIPGPYYVTAEAKIYGPVVDLAAIKSKMGGAYAIDYTYVQWGTNPFYRVYVDNTLQEVYYGQMIDVINRFGPWGGYAMETSFRDTLDNMKNVGALDPSSEMGVIRYFGNLPGTFIGMNPSGTHNLNTTTDSWKAVVIHAKSAYSYISPYGYYYSSTVTIDLNGTRIIGLTSPSTTTADYRVMNASGYSGGLEKYVWTIYIYKATGNRQNGDAAATLYLGEVVHYETNMPDSAYRVYTVMDSPGTGFVSKYVSPSSPVAGSTINVTVRLDPPSAEKMNITDFYPNTFTWASVDILLEKFKVDTGLEETAYVNVVPVPDGSNMTFTIYYNQALDILQSLQSDEYIYLTYSLRVPDVAGEYTLPAATMSYLIPIPQT